MRPTIPQAANIWRVKNIANMLYFAQMVIFYQPQPEQPSPLACIAKYSSGWCCGARYAAEVSHPRG
jgi:hypothetical protein